MCIVLGLYERSLARKGVVKWRRLDLGPTDSGQRLRLRFQRVEPVPYGNEESTVAGRQATVDGAFHEHLPQDLFFSNAGL